MARSAFLVVAIAACTLPGGAKDRCRENVDCNGGRVCVSGSCADTTTIDAATTVDVDAAVLDGPASIPLVAACAASDVVLAGDIDGDGRDEILCHSTTRAETIALSLASDRASFIARVWQQGFCGPGATLLVGDVDGDARADLVCHDADLSRTTVLLSVAGAVAAPWNPAWCGPASFIVADVDGDKRADCVCHEPDTLYTSVALATPPSFTPKGVWLTGFCPAPTTLAIADLDGDGRGDAVCGGSSAPFRVASAESGRFGAPVAIAGAPCAGVASYADVNGDGKADVICHDATRAVVSAALGTGSAFLAPRDAAVDDCGPGAYAVAGDFDGDRMREVACVRPAASTIAIVRWPGGAPPSASVVRITER